MNPGVSILANIETFDTVHDHCMCENVYPG
jgi:hypothetical protein